MKTLDLHITDIVHNSIRAGASRIEVSIENSIDQNIWSLSIIDNGCGMDKDTLQGVFDAFRSSRKERKIGMGLALLKYQAELCDGIFNISSEKGSGTKVLAVFKRDHIDRQPDGDISGTIAGFICQITNVNFVFSYKTDEDLFEISSEEIKSVFGEIELNDFSVFSAIKELIQNSILS
jgi:anti-sigma regulatory factor (Ser/Thr protein kinase)